MNHHENPTFIDDDGMSGKEQTEIKSPDDVVKRPERDLWGKQIEFLLSCIAMSVGLGNVWRFPFTALENGGGAFLIPYLIVLFLVGKPLYYLEMIIGQFSSSGTVKVYDLCPAMRGVGIGQIFAVTMISTYYVSIMGLTLKYFLASFESILPWSICYDEWKTGCIPSQEKNIQGMNNVTNSSINGDKIKLVSSAELYFLKDVLKEVDDITNGIGVPNWQLVVGLLVSWIVIFLIIIKGVRSSGKAAYFLAIFPYVVLGILFIRAVTLPGAGAGMLYFINPQWNQLLNPKVWYAAVTQVFFSLSVCLGLIIMYASYNKFDNKNVYRDASIVSLLDTFTSLLAGFTIFGILGHLAHQVGTDDIGSVVKGGAGLAFISYPDAIAKFDVLPQAFSVLFFAMLFTLGVGSNIAMTSGAVTIIRDYFPHLNTILCNFLVVVVSFAIGLVYVTPGGQFILNLVDYFGVSMIGLCLGIVELICIGWIYGVDRICKDTEFMTGRNPGLYWRLCWGIITPFIMILILIYTFVSYEPITYKDVVYPDGAYVIGWLITSFGLVQVPIWAFYAIVKQPGITIWDKIVGAFKPKEFWGPSDVALNMQYKKIVSANENNIFQDNRFFAKIKRNIFG